MRTPMLVLVALLSCGAALGGCGDELGAAGDGCSTSADCESGLLCDTTAAPPVCSKMLTPRPDLAGADLSGGGDFSANANDLSHAD